MKNLLLIVSLSGLLAACATQLPQSTSKQSSSSTPQSALTANPVSPDSKDPLKTGPRSETAKAEDPLPTLELTEDLLYKILTAEIAFNQGDWQTGYINMLALAQQTRDPRIARRAAEIALAAKHMDEALNAVRLWRTLAPHSDEAAQYYLSFIILGNNLREAQPILAQRLQEARPQTRSLMVLQVQRLLARAKDKITAFAMLEELLAPYPDLPEAHMALSQSAFSKGDIERAQKEAYIALKAKPDSELAALALAQVIPDKSKALQSLSDFLIHHPKSREVRLAYARMLVEQKKYEPARKEFQVLLKQQPQDLTTLFALGILSMQVNDSQAAEKYLTTYLKIMALQPDEERDPTQALLILAQIAEERKDPETALKWLEQIEPGEGYINAQIKRAQVNAKRGQLPLARKLLKEIKPSNEREQMQVLIAEGQILREANHLQEALAILESGVKRFPDNTDLLYDYAMLAEKLEQLDLMETTLRKIIALAPSNPHAYNALGFSLAERNIRLQEAFTLIEKALNLAPEDPFIIDSMGWVQFRLGKLKEAETLLRRAYELRPDAEIAIHLGEVLWIKGQKEDAEKLWRDARTKDPQNNTLKNTLVRFNVNL